MHHWAAADAWCLACGGVAGVVGTSDPRSETSYLPPKFVTKHAIVLRQQKLDRRKDESDKPRSVVRGGVVGVVGWWVCARSSQ